jgi:hypothetical protein
MTSVLDDCLAILKALHVSEVRYYLSGGGDSGTSELEDVVYYDGRHEAPLPTVTIDIADGGDTVSLTERLDRLVEDLPDGDWINNEGGYGRVILRPQHTDPELRVECDMTYGEDERDPDFEDDEEFLASSFNESNADTDSTALIVDDSTLQPGKGASQ